MRRSGGRIAKSPYAGVNPLHTIWLLGRVMYADDTACFVEALSVPFADRFGPKGPHFCYFCPRGRLERGMMGLERFPLFFLTDSVLSISIRSVKIIS